MRRLGRLTLVVAALFVTVLVVLSCGRQTPTQPIQSSALHLKVQAWHEGDVYAYTVDGRPDEMAIRFIRIAVADAAGSHQFLTYSQALSTLSDDAVVRVVSVWRIVPSHVGKSPEALGNVRIGDGEFAGRFKVQGTDPEPPLPPEIPECEGCCSGGDVSWGCVKCCYN